MSLGEPASIHFQYIADFTFGAVKGIRQRLHIFYVHNCTLFVDKRDAERNISITHPHAMPLDLRENKHHAL